MQDFDELPDYDGPPLSSASLAVQMLDTREPSSLLSSLADTIQSRAEDLGLQSLTPTEAQFVALEVLHKGVAFDGIALLYYNEADYIPVILAATKRTGAELAHDLILRGLAALGLDGTASGDQIRVASEDRLIPVIEGKDNSAEGVALEKTFDEIEEEFNEHVETLSEEMLTLLTSYTSEFLNFV
jgi:hypothetical protein